MLNITIKDMPKDLRPYEKCAALGCEALTDAELLAIILRTGTKNKNSLELASDILSLDRASEGLLGLLHCSKEDFMTLQGVGEIKAFQLLALAELSRRIWKTGTRKRLDFHSPETIASYYMEEMRHREQEELRAMFFNTKQVLIKELLISRGTVNASLATPREIFIEALRYRAVSLILVHNHPSGDPSPSREDVAFTKRVRLAGEMVGIALLDHIIIGDNAFLSLKERGIL